MMMFEMRSSSSAPAPLPPEGARFVLENPLPLDAYAALDEGRPVQRRRHTRGQGARQRRRRTRRRANDTSSDESDGNDSEESDDSGGGGGGGGGSTSRAVRCMDVEEIDEELGPHGPRHECFACQYVGQDRAAKIPDHRLAAIFKLMADGIGVAWPPALAVTIAKNYATWRKEINATRKSDEDKLPKWTAASILDHWYNHTLDPQIALWLDMMALRYQMTMIRRHSLERYDPVTGERKVDEKQWSIYMSAMRQYYILNAKDPRKLTFFNEGAMINYGNIANNGISRARRPGYDFFAQGKRTRTVATVGLR